MRDQLTYQAAAILAGGYISLYAGKGSKLLILALFLLILVRIAVLWKPPDYVARSARPEMILLVCGLLAGFIYGSFADRSIPPACVLDGIEVEGVLKDWSVSADSAYGIIHLGRVTIREQQNMQETADGSTSPEYLGQSYVLKLYPQGKTYSDEWLQVKPGDSIAFSAKLEHPPAPGTSGQFDLPLYYAVRNLSGFITAKGNVTLLQAGKPSAAWVIRNKVRTVLNAYWPQDGGVLEGILFGETSGVSPETMHIYKASGVMHVFAASGANVAFVITFVMAVLFWAPPRIRVVITLIALIFYAVLCRGNPPILRATILGVAVLIGMLGNRKVHSIRLLWLAGLLLFIWQPLFLKDTSFQLSFAATWGMVALSPRLEKTRLLQRLPALIRGAAAVAIGTQAAALPVLIDVFHRLSVVGLFTNIFALFLLGAVLQIGLIGVVLIFIPGAPVVFFQAALWMLRAEGYLLELCAGLPWAYFWVLNPGKIFWLAWYVFLAVYLIGTQKVWFMIRVQLRRLERLGREYLTAVAGHKQNRKWISEKWRGRIAALGKRVERTVNGATHNEQGLKRRFLCFLAPIMAMVVLVSVWPDSGQLRLTFLDVGQGDCILISTANETLMVDTGPRSEKFDAGERIVIPYLMERRIRSLDMLLITHEDNDHLGGAYYILSTVPTAQVAVPSVGPRFDNEAWQNGLPASIRLMPEKLLPLKAGDKIEFRSGLQLEVIGPVTVLQETNADANNNSLVLRISYGQTTILLTGDMEMEEMRSIADRGAVYQADFIKLPHHGSKGSFDEAWFDRTYPQAVFITVGRNSFGHPSPEVTNYWRERGVPVYRTDWHGTVDLIIDQRGYQVFTGRQR